MDIKYVSWFSGCNEMYGIVIGDYCFWDIDGCGASKPTVTTGAIDALRSGSMKEITEKSFTNRVVNAWLAHGYQHTGFIEMMEND